MDSEEAVTIYNLRSGRQRYCCVGSDVDATFQRVGCFCGTNPCVCGSQVWRGACATGPHRQLAALSRDFSS